VVDSPSIIFKLLKKFRPRVRWIWSQPIHFVFSSSIVYDNWLRKIIVELCLSKD
jgi:hypothetical protein